MAFLAATQIRSWKTRQRFKKAAGTLVEPLTLIAATLITTLPMALVCQTLTSTQPAVASQAKSANSLISHAQQAKVPARLSLAGETLGLSQVDAEGMLQDRLFMKSLAHSSLSEQTEMAEPLLLVNGRGESMWSVSAAKGTVFQPAVRAASAPSIRLAPAVFAKVGGGDLEAGGYLSLRGNVLLTQKPAAESNIILSATHLAFYPDQKIALTKQPVELRMGASKTRAGAMRADLAAGKLYLQASATQRVSTTVSIAAN